MEEEMLGDQAAENVTLAIVASPLRKCDAFFPFPHPVCSLCLHQWFCSHWQTYPEDCNGGCLMATTIWLSWFGLG